MSKLLKNKNLLITILVCFFATLFLVSSLLTCPNSNIANAAPSSSNSMQTNQNFTISVLDRNTGYESSKFTTADLSFGKCFVYQWKDVNLIKFNYNPNIGDPPPKKYQVESRPQTEYYDLSISIEYLQEYKEKGIFDGSAELKLIEGAYTTSVSGIDSYKTLSTLPSNFVFSIDQGRSSMTASGQAFQIKEWGIYRFKLLINGQETYSDFFAIEPTKEIKETPAYKYSTTSSESSLHNDYIFTITNVEKYKYIDIEKLVWYVTGKSEDGTMYILTPEDLQLEQFVGKAYNPLYPAVPYSRNGLTFRFDDGGIAGKWDVWCEYHYEGSLNDPLISEVAHIKTGTFIKASTIILIVLAAMVVSVVLVLIFALVRAKKDKVF